jgi:hypothetical protein
MPNRRFLPHGRTAQACQRRLRIRYSECRFRRFSITGATPTVDIIADPIMGADTEVAIVGGITAVAATAEVVTAADTVMVATGVTVDVP